MHDDTKMEIRIKKEDMLMCTDCGHVCIQIENRVIDSRIQYEKETFRQIPSADFADE